MSRPYPSIEVLRAAPTGGLRHVSEFLALALGEPTDNAAPPAAALASTSAGNAGIAKCPGAGLACCSVCVRALTHTTDGQQWCEPNIVDGACVLYASLERFANLINRGEIV